MWCGGITPHILNLGTGWRWVVSFMSLPLYPREGVHIAHSLGDWMGPWANLDDFKESLLPMVGIGLCFLGHGACTPSHYTHSVILAATCMVNDVNVFCWLTQFVLLHVTRSWMITVQVVSEVDENFWCFNVIFAQNVNWTHEGGFVCLSAYFIPWLLYNRFWWILSMWSAPKIVWKI